MKGLTVLLMATFCFLLPVEILASSEIDSLLAVSKNLEKADSSRCNALFSLAEKYADINIDSAHYFSDLAIDISKNLPPKFKVYSLVSKVKIFNYSGDSESCQELAEKALAISLEMKEPVRLQKIYTYLADTQNEVGNMEKALEYHQKSYEISPKELKDKFLFTFNSSLLYEQLGDFKKQEKLLLEAKSYVDSLNNEEYKIYVDMVLGNAFLSNAKYDKAIQLLENILKESDPSPFVKVQILHTLGRAYIENKEPKNAITHLDDALKSAMKIGSPQLVADSYHYFGQAYLNFGDWKNAISNLSKAFRMFTENGYLVGQENCSEQLFTAYKKNGNYKIALDFHESWKVLADSLYSAEKAKELTKKELNYEFDKEKELLALQKQKDEEVLIAEAKANRNLAGGIGALALLGFGFFYNARRQNKIIEQKNDQLESLNTTKDRIFAIIGHDLRKPAISFRGISKVINYLVENEDYTRLKKVGTEVEKDALSLYKLTDNLLSWALMQKDVMPHNPSEVSPSEIAAETITVFQRVAEEKNITLRSEVSDELRVFADPNSLATIIRNITDNALKYTPDGGSVIIKAIDSAQGVKIVVEDTGIGIAQNKIKDIFLLQKDKSERGTAGEKGTGIGLHLIKELININHGEVEVESEIGKGTKVVVMLPKRSLAAA